MDRLCYHELTGNADPSTRYRAGVIPRFPAPPPAGHAPCRRTVARARDGTAAGRTDAVPGATAWGNNIKAVAGASAAAGIALAAAIGGWALFVDLPPGALYIRVAIKRGRQVSDYINEQIARLEARINTLVSTCDRLREENRMLQKSQESLNAEKATLLERNEMARSRIEAMISRLKQMEHG
ncbi:TIGR02449 family protein [Ectothiorhodospiraceae bacterium WFHF3C12]|nr:TIGR02449 family protein [Ectothiorhodospiraceae bacterium WFHF3C12]